MCMADHGVRMKGTGTIQAPWSFSQLPSKLEGIRIYPGIEFNLWDTSGHLDNYFPSAFEHIHFSIGSIHKNVIPLLDRDAHTESYIQAMDLACIDLIGHPCIPHTSSIKSSSCAQLPNGTISSRSTAIPIAAHPGCKITCRKIVRL